MPFQANYNSNDGNYGDDDDDNGNDDRPKVSACLPLPSLFVRYIHVTGMISFPASEDVYGSDTGLRNNWPLTLEPTASFDTLVLILVSQVPLYVLSRLPSSLCSRSHWKGF